MKQPVTKPKADVRGVELTDNEKEIIENAISDIIGVDEILLKRLCEDFETIITARLTALQSAHDVEVKELKRKVLEAIPKEVETIKADLDYLHQVGYNEAIAQTTQSVRDAFKDNK